jgi:hypothetical protein
MAEDEDAARKRRKGTIGGLVVIAFALVGALVIYIDDSRSMDYSRIMHARDFAILHAVLWTIVGLGIIAWHNRPPPDDEPSNLDAGDDPLAR